MRRLLIEKAQRRLTVYEDGEPLFCCPVALGRNPEGPKQAEGDGRTPEGEYYICLKRAQGKFGPALGISYPSAREARAAAAEGRLDADLVPLFEAAEQNKTRPPWGTALGGEIYLHGGGDDSDWTAGCIALSDENMARLFALCQEGDAVTILP